jgi:quercetin dioxygenase-like cupin family protein
MSQTIPSTPESRQAEVVRRCPVATKTLPCAAVGGAAGVIVAVALLIGWNRAVASPQPVPAAAAPAVHEAKVTPLFARDLKDYPGKEGLMINVEYPPGAVDPVHRHHAHAFVYVLEGTIVMQVKGGNEVTLKPGHTFYEGPDDLHTVGRNASTTEPAKFVVVLLKDKDAPVLVPEK